MAAKCGTVVLALDLGVLETGWAVLDPMDGGLPKATGAIRPASARKSTAEHRIKLLLVGLEELAEEWRPGVLAHSRPTRIRWPMPALELLEEQLRSWSQNRGLELHAYTAQQVRRAVTGRSGASRYDLAYAVMERLGLIGRNKSSREWEAVAVGYFHLAQSAPERTP